MKLKGRIGQNLKFYPKKRIQDFWWMDRFEPGRDAELSFGYDEIQPHVLDLIVDWRSFSEAKEKGLRQLWRPQISLEAIGMDEIMLEENISQVIK